MLNETNVIANISSSICMNNHIFNNNNNNNSNNCNNINHDDNHHQIIVDQCEFSNDQQLIYRGEGNSSLVIAIRTTCQVIRLLKSDAKKLRNANDVLTHLLQHIDFNHNILPDIIGEHLFSPPKLVYLDDEQLKIIKNFVRGKRPSFRLEKTLTNCSYALLMSDCCTIPQTINYDWCKNSIIAVEIKPKQGFLPDSNLFGKNSLLKLKAKFCRFGLSQYYKLKKKSIKSINAYCPLDLFSGCQQRQLSALLCLMENPQNNFRVFINSHLLFDDQCDVEQLRKILTRFFSKNYHISNSSNCNDRLKKFNQNNQISRTNDPLKSFGLLLTQILNEPLMDDGKENRINDNHQGNCRTEFYRKGNRNDYSNLTNLKREIKNLQYKERFVFCRTFLEYFEKLSTTAANDNNDSYFNLNDNENCDLLFENLNSIDNFNINNYKKCKTVRMNNVTTSNDQCELHSSLHKFDCDCFNDKNLHNLPIGSILSSILCAQKLDKIDSLKAVELMTKLFLNYKKFKSEILEQKGIKFIYPLDPLKNPECFEYLEKFIIQNSSDLDTLWRFLISLTAKDCSIMIALQHIDNNDNDNNMNLKLNDKIFQSKNVATNTLQINSSSNSSTLIQIFDNNDNNFGESYNCRLSIIDLDYKPACKIQRMLHNDRRMIMTFINSIHNNNNLNDDQINIVFSNNNNNTHGNDTTIGSINNEN